MDVTINAQSSDVAPVQPKVTAKTFRDPVMKFIGQRLGFTPDLTMSHHDVYGPVLAMTGIDPQAYGIAPGTSALQTHRWIQFAVMSLRSEGLMITPQKGQWGLTEAGVRKARSLIGSLGGGTVEAPKVEAPKVEAPKVEAPIKVNPVFAIYEVDPYLRGLAVAATNCIGFFSARSETCKTCPLHLQCRNKQMADLSSLAALLRKEDEDAEKAAAATVAYAPLIVEEAAPPKKAWDNSGIEKIVMHYDAVCYRCGSSIAKESSCYWKHNPQDEKNSGVFHLECL